MGIITNHYKDPYLTIQYNGKKEGFFRGSGIPGNTITYNTLLDACAKCGTMARVPAIFEKMKLLWLKRSRAKNG